MSQASNADSAFTAISSCLLQLALVIVASHYLTATLPLVLIAVFILQKVYLRTSRQLRILEIEAKAPLYTTFTETIHGLATIRAFRWEQRSMDRCLSLTDRAQKPFYLLYNVQFWLNLVLNLIIAGTVIVLVGLVVALRDTTDAGFVGVALVTIMTFNQSLANLLKYGTLLEITLGAVERVKTFCELTPQEQDSPTSQAKSDWLKRGDVRIENLVACYEWVYMLSMSNLLHTSKLINVRSSEPVLHHINLSIVAGQHVALCGASGRSVLRCDFHVYLTNNLQWQVIAYHRYSSYHEDHCWHGQHR